jgi:hypothetical protein
MDLAFLRTNEHGDSLCAVFAERRPARPSPLFSWMEWSRRSWASKLFSHLWDWQSGQLPSQEWLRDVTPVCGCDGRPISPALEGAPAQAGQFAPEGSLACFPGQPVSGSAAHQTPGEWGTNRLEKPVLLRLRAQGGVATAMAQEGERLCPTAEEMGANDHAGWPLGGDAPRSHM